MTLSLSLQSPPLAPAAHVRAPGLLHQAIFVHAWRRSGVPGLTLRDAAVYLSDWDAFRVEGEPIPRSLTAEHVEDGPIRNPFRHVGRNEACPCGSGKKFKKCCLEQARFG